MLTADPDADVYKIRVRVGTPDSSLINGKGTTQVPAIKSLRPYPLVAVNTCCFR